MYPKHRHRQSHGQMPPLSSSQSLSLSRSPFSEINQPTCTWEMRWHFPIMRAMGGREGITAFPGPAIDRDWHFPLQSQNVHVLLRLSCCACVCMCVWFKVRFGSRRQGGHPSCYSHIPKSMCVYICVPGYLCMCVAPVYAWVQKCVCVYVCV